MKNNIFSKLKKELPGIKKNIILKEHTTFKIGGPAQYFFEANSKESIIRAILVAKKNRLPFFVLGGGSKLLVADEGYKGLVVKDKSSNLKIKGFNKYFKFFCDAGVPLARLVSESSRVGATGFEWAIGIPSATIGGAIIGNAGAFGESIKDSVSEAEVFDLESKKIKIFKNKNCNFGYRNSIFKKNKNLIILSVMLKLKKGKKSKINRTMKEHLRCRQKNQPLGFSSVGSIFKNFTLQRNAVSSTKIKNLFKEFPELGKFEKTNKIPTAFLIEKCGLSGKRIGNVKISKKHTNFILNLGNGKSEDVKKLIKMIKKEVKKRFSIVLEEEIQFL